LQRGWCSQTIPRTKRTSVATKRILFSDDTVLSVAIGSACVISAARRTDSKAARGTPIQETPIAPTRQ